MIRHKKEMKQHRLAEFNKKLEALSLEYKAEARNYQADKSIWVKYQELYRKLAEEYGVNWKNRELMGFYFSHVVHKPRRTNPKHDSNRRIRRSVIKHNIKPLKDRFKEEIKDYDPDNDAFFDAYADGNY